MRVFKDNLVFLPARHISIAELPGRRGRGPSSSELRPRDDGVAVGYNLPSGRQRMTAIV